MTHFLCSWAPSRLQGPACVMLLLLRIVVALEPFPAVQESNNTLCQIISYIWHLHCDLHVLKSLLCLFGRRWLQMKGEHTLWLRFIATQWLTARWWFFINTSSSMWRQGCTLCVFCNSCSAIEGEVTRAAHEWVSCRNAVWMNTASIKCRFYTWTMETNHWIVSIILLIVMWPFVTTWKHISAYFALQQDFIPPSFCDKGGCYYHWISLFYLFESVLQLLRQCSVIFFFVSHYWWWISPQGLHERPGLRLGLPCTTQEQKHWNLPNQM